MRPVPVDLPIFEVAGSSGPSTATAGGHEAELVGGMYRQSFSLIDPATNRSR